MDTVIYPAGGMYSTVGDLGTWAGTGFGSTLLSEKLGAARVGGPTTRSDLITTAGIMRPQGNCRTERMRTSQQAACQSWTT